MAQNDKKNDDDLLYDLLTATYEDDNWHAPVTIHDSLLIQTNEKDIFLHRGDTFQIRSLNDNLYLRRFSDQTLAVLFDRRYPLESFTNLLLNRIEKNTLIINLTLHVYGNKKEHLVMPMQRVYDRMARNVRLYVVITSISAKMMEATLVMHHPGINVIHLFVFKVATKELFKNQGTIQADLYSNIPQGNIKSLVGL